MSRSLRTLGSEKLRVELVLITYDDNSYVSRFTKVAFEAVGQGWLDMMPWDAVHSYGSPGQGTLRCYAPFQVGLAKCKVDIVAAMARITSAKRVGMTDGPNAGNAVDVEQLLALADAAIRIGTSSPRRRMFTSKVDE